MSACECAQCGAVFTGLTAFDAHQDVDYRRHPAVVCRPPAACGLVRNRHGRWGQPQTPQGAARLAALMESRAGTGPDRTLPPRRAFFEGHGLAEPSRTLGDADLTGGVIADLSDDEADAFIGALRDQ